MGADACVPPQRYDFSHGVYVAVATVWDCHAYRLAGGGGVALEGAVGV